MEIPVILFLEICLEDITWNVDLYHYVYKRWSFEHYLIIGRDGGKVNVVTI